MLEAEGADFKEIDTHNILADEIMREELKEFSDWPTFPQVFSAGFFMVKGFTSLSYKVFRSISKVNSLLAVILCMKCIKKMNSEKNYLMLK